MREQTAIKLKTAGIIVGVTAVVYVLIKYMLPLVAPFAFAFIIACIIDKPVGFMYERFGLKRIIGATVMTVLLTAILGLVIFYGARTLLGQARQLAMKLPEYSSMAAKMAEDCCDRVDDGLNLDEGTSYRIVSGQIDNAKGIVNDKLIPAVMNGSWSFISSCAAFLTAFAFMIMAAVFISRDMPKIKVQCDNSIFGTELKFLGGRLKDILTTYVKTQLIIMTLTCIICSAGLYFMGNPYALLLGVLIGIIDALPVLGTGTVFIPWCIILFVMGKYSSAVAILVISCSILHKRASRTETNGCRIRSVTGVNACLIVCRADSLWDKRSDNRPGSGNSYKGNLYTPYKKTCLTGEIHL